MIKLKVKDIEDFVKNAAPHAEEIEIEDAEGNRLPIESVEWTMEKAEGDMYLTAKLILKLS